MSRTCQEEVFLDSNFSASKYSTSASKFARTHSTSNILLMATCDVSDNLWSTHRSPSCFSALFPVRMWINLWSSFTLSEDKPLRNTTNHRRLANFESQITQKSPETWQPMNEPFCFSCVLLLWLYVTMSLAVKAIESSNVGTFFVASFALLFFKRSARSTFECPSSVFDCSIQQRTAGQLPKFAENFRLLWHFHGAIARYRAAGAKLFLLSNHHNKFTGLLHILFSARRVFAVCTE